MIDHFGVSDGSLGEITALYGKYFSVIQNPETGETIDQEDLKEGDILNAWSYRHNEYVDHVVIKTDKKYIDVKYNDDLNHKPTYIRGHGSVNLGD